MKIYHNPRCSKSRSGLEYLKSKNVEFEVYDYLKNGLSVDELKDILLKTNLKPVDLVRTQEDYYKKELKGRNFTDEEWIRIVIDNPKLLKRPIVVDRYKAVIALPAENIDELIK